MYQASVASSTARRRAVRRTAIILGVVAASFYALSLLQVFTGRY
jgi:hypothetical protein